MKPCLGIIAALPREVSALVKGWTRTQPSVGVVLYTNGDAVVACAGMGTARAALAARAAMEARPVTALISAGLAGACDPALRVGEIVRAGVVLDLATGERFEDSQLRQVLVTADAIASVREKARLYAGYGAVAVDMEAAAIARVARAQGLDFHAIKAISDEADLEVEELGQFASPEGQFKEMAFALHALLRPQLWGKMLALARNSSAAVAALTAALEAELDWYRKRD